MVGCAGQGWWRHGAALGRSAGLAWPRCTAVTAGASDPLAAQLAAALSSLDPASVTAAILTRLRDDGALPPDAVEVP